MSDVEKTEEVKEEVEQVSENKKKEVKNIHKMLNRVQELIEVLEKKSLSMDKNADMVDRMVRMFERTSGIVLKKNQDSHDALQDEFKLIQERVKDWEDSLYYIFHNIKKNQFLYSHYPEDWVKSYLDLKGGTQYENEFMQKKLEEKMEKKRAKYDKTVC